MPIYKRRDTDDTDDPLITQKTRRFSLGSKIKAIKNARRGQRCRKISQYSENFTSCDTKSPLTLHKRYGNTFNCVEERISTCHGSLLVARQGAKPGPKTPVILTYHDLGLNYISNYEGFFSLSENCSLLASFTIYHINAPGQESHKLDPDYKFPSIDILANQIKDVLDYYKIRTFIGLGTGVGANILTRFALANPKPVEGLILINANCSQASWRDWFWAKRNIKSLISSSSSSPPSSMDVNSSSNYLPNNVTDYLLWHHFGTNLRHRDSPNRDIIDIYRSYFNGITVHPANLGLFLESYFKRSPIRLSRNPHASKTKLSCQVLLVTGSASPYLDSTIIMNSRLDPKSTTWLKIDGSAMVLEERPHKVSQALHLFLQGLGYPLKEMVLKRARLSGLSLPSITMGTSLLSIPSIPSVPSTPVSPISAQQVFFA